MIEGPLPLVGQPLPPGEIKLAFLQLFGASTEVFFRPLAISSEGTIITGSHSC
jgi:hypothetical protein